MKFFSPPNNNKSSENFIIKKKKYRKKIYLIDFFPLLLYRNSHMSQGERRKNFRHTSRKCVLFSVRKSFSCCFSVFAVVKNLLPLNWRKLKRVRGRRNGKVFLLRFHVRGLIEKHRNYNTSLL